ncbi:hypothetical protein REC12_22985 [Desulfosporosinus sp. PR]|uniref:hypothetical protein n=1 Tax=Candidatus Desulfosporosinus nitrosoreducens TaxID=3401928 RepID=UPI0027F58A33|nr:hypothetical protein [Desulfosporosinus sp. PR]MDQ7096466.1 hypothetical protein [Desulfosporosinus sp. PR]
MIIDPKRISDLEQELGKIDTNELLISLVYVLGNKHSFRNRFFFALMYGISFEELTAMYNLINDKKNGDLEELVRTFNNNFPDYKDKIFELVACYEEEGILTEFCDRFYDHFGKSLVGYTIKNINELFPQIKIKKD